MAVNDIRTLKFSVMNDVKYDCTNDGYSSLSTIHALTLRVCQLACLNSMECRTVNFYQSSNQCELFVDIPDQFGILVTNLGCISMTVIDNRKLSARKKTTTTTFTTTTTTKTTTTTIAPICSNTCPGGLTSDVTTTCGRKCYTVPLGAFGTPTGSVGSTSNCYMNSTYCPGGSYVVVRNTYSSVNFDCDGSYGCNANGGCCVGIGSSPNFGIYCISCHY